MTPIPHSLYSGGPAGLVYGYILVWIGTASIFATLGELASMYDKRQSGYGRADLDPGRLQLVASTTGSQCLLHAHHISSSAM